MNTFDRLSLVSIENFKQIRQEIQKIISKHDSLTQIKDKISILSDGYNLDQSGLRDTAFFVAEIFGMMITLDDYKVPFKAYCTLADGRTTLCLDHITGERIDVVNQTLALGIDSDAANARLNDVLWTINKDVANAKEAIKYYLAIADTSHEQFNSDPLIASERAIQLWGQINGGEEMRLKIYNVILNNAPLDQTEPDGFLKFNWIELLPKLANKAEIASIVLKINGFINESRLQRNWRKARKYNRLNLKLYGFLGDTMKNEAAKQLEVDLYVEELEDAKLNGLNPSQLQHLYTKAITSSFNVSGRKLLRKKLLDELQDIQAEIPHTLTKISEGVDVSKAVLNIKKEIEQKTILEALEYVSSIALEKDKTKSYKSTKEILGESPLHAMFGRTMLDEKGKVINKSEGISLADISSGNIRDIVSQHTLMHFAVNGGVAINSVALLQSKYRLRKSDLDDLVFQNPFIPQHREYQFRDGLWNGLCGNWTESLYVLTPLLENSLRELMRRTGFSTVKMDQNGLQKEINLTDFIYDAAFKEIFGEDLSFQLQVLLVDPNGLNIRNNVAHGLVPDGLAYSEYAAFFWAQVLHLCFRFQRLFYNKMSQATTTPD